MKKILCISLLALLFSCEKPVATEQEEEEIMKIDTTSKCGCPDDYINYQQIKKI